jgi:hypothetical protein
MTQSYIKVNKIFPARCNVMSTTLTSSSSLCRPRQFWNAQAGAVTTEWVVIGAAVMGIGLGSVAAVRNGAGDLATSILTSLANAAVAAIDPSSATDEGPEETYVRSTLSDGREQVDVYVDGKLVRSEVTDSTGAHNWTSIVTRFDENGARIGELVTYDDGRLRDTDFVNGVRREERWTDVNNVTSYRTTTNKYDEAGRLIAVDVVNNNLTMRQDRYENGRIVERLTLNQNGAVTMGEAYSYTLSDSGQLEGRRIDYSDGRVLETAYQNGRAVSQTVTDTLNAHRWQSETTTWNAAGQVISNELINNDGSRRERVYEAGRIASEYNINASGQMTTGRMLTYDDSGRTLSDTRLGADGSVTSSVHNVYQADGKLAAQTTRGADGSVTAQDTRVYDSLGRISERNIAYADGRQTQYAYTDGLVRTQTLVDPSNTQSWSSQTYTYDSSGRVADHVVLNDSGTSRLDTYLDGRVHQRFDRDASGAVTGVTSFSYQTDSLARMTQRDITYPDGRISVTEYQGAEVPVRQVITDPLNRNSWSSQVYQYDNMGRTANLLVTYNAGNSYEDVYVAGVRTERINRDANGNVTSIQTF